MQCSAVDGSAGTCSAVQPIDTKLLVILTIITSCYDEVIVLCHVNIYNLNKVKRKALQILYHYFNTFVSLTLCDNIFILADIGRKNK